MGARLVDDGFVVLPAVLSKDECGSLKPRFDALNAGAGTRTVLRTEWGRALLGDPRVTAILEQIRPGPWFPVRCIAFDKSPESNWVLGWHQDRKIAVASHEEVAGFTSWSEKEGLVHCQPPVEFLESMVAVRLHLDPCGEANGALKVIPGSHRHGLLDIAATQEAVLHGPVVVTELAAGDALVMRPMLLHASSKSTSEAHRRVIHFEFCSRPLPEPLRWVDWSAV
ncbi:MAG: hypothetical protein HONBIEJF_01057 [Fimbriimonadaceae bacterium]|nr:hypothetical protein [Fimbriimonadaceae bacterium]